MCFNEVKRQNSKPGSAKNFWVLTFEFLLRVQFHDQLLLNIFRNAFSFRISNESTFHIRFAPVKPVEFCILTTKVTADRSIACTLAFQTNNITWLAAVRRNVKRFTVNGN